MHPEAFEPPRSPRTWPFSSLAPSSSFGRLLPEPLTLHTFAEEGTPLDEAGRACLSSPPNKSASSRNGCVRRPENDDR